MTDLPSIWMHYDPPKPFYLLAQRHRITPPLESSNNTAVSTSKSFADASNSPRRDAIFQDFCFPAFLNNRIVLVFEG